MVLPFNAQWVEGRPEGVGKSARFRLDHRKPTRLPRQSTRAAQRAASAAIQPPVEAVMVTGRPTLDNSDRQVVGCS